MAKLPIYNSQGNISPEKMTIETGQTIKPLDEYSQSAIAMQKTGYILGELAEKWQESKNEVETLAAKNKMFEQSSSILQEAANYSGYTEQKDIDQKKLEFQQQLQGITPELLNGFSSQRAARNFQMTSQLAMTQNALKLDEIMRNKTIDLGSSNLLKSGELNMKAFTQSGNIAYKQNYMNDVDSAFKAGIIDAEKATALKQSTSDWNYNYVYSQLLNNPYFKASPEVMADIDPVKQRTLKNFARTEQKRLQAEALQNAVADFYSNPTKKNLARIHRLNPASKKNGNYQTIVNSSPNFKAVSNLEGYSDAVEAIKNLSEIDTTSYNGKMEYIKRASETAYRIYKSNMSNDGNASLSVADKNKLIQMLYEKMNNTTFKNEIKNMPDLSKLKATEIAGKGNIVQARQNLESFNAKKFGKNLPFGKQSVLVKIDDIGKRTAERVLACYLAGNFKAGQQEYQKGLQQAIRTKYWYIPELQKPDLQVGQHFTVNGKVYKFNGYTQKDIIVEGN